MTYNPTVVEEEAVELQKEAYAAVSKAQRALVEAESMLLAVATTSAPSVSNEIGHLREMMAQISRVKVDLFCSIPLPDRMDDFHPPAELAEMLGDPIDTGLL